MTDLSRDDLNTYDMVLTAARNDALDLERTRQDWASRRENAVYNFKVGQLGAAKHRGSMVAAAYGLRMEAAFQRYTFFGGESSYEELEAMVVPGVQLPRYDRDE